MSEDRKLRELLLKATENAEFRKKFLSDPAGVAKENGVSLDPKHVKKIQKAADFIDSLVDIKVPPGPIYYPIDRFLQFWQMDAMREFVGAVYTIPLPGGGFLQMTASGRIIHIPPGYYLNILGGLARGGMWTQ
jgi:hypothetical protein